MSRGPKLPAPPDAPRRIILTPFQLVSLPLMALLPILAVVGVFGGPASSRAADGTPVELEAQYPGRTRFGSREELEFAVANVSDGPVSGVVLRVERRYIDSYRNVSFTPSVSEVTESHYLVELGELPAGASQTVTLALIPDRYWAFSGSADLLVGTGASGGGAEQEESRAQVELSTLVFP